MPEVPSYTEAQSTALRAAVERYHAYNVQGPFSDGHIAVICFASEAQAAAYEAHCRSGNYAAARAAASIVLAIESDGYCHS